MDYLQFFRERRERNRAQIRSEKTKALLSSIRKESLSHKPKNCMIMNQTYNFAIEMLQSSKDKNDIESIEKHLTNLRDTLINFYSSKIDSRVDINGIIQSGLIEILMSFLNKEFNYDEKIIKLILWIFSILECGSLDDCIFLVNLGIIENSLYVLNKTNNKEIMNIILIGLANISFYKEISLNLFENNIVAIIFQLFQNEQIIEDFDLIKSILILIKNICDYDEEYKIELNCLPLLIILLMEIKDEKIYDECLNILILLGRKANYDYIDELLNNDFFIKNIIFCLNSINEDKIIKALNIIANLSLGKNSQTLLIYQKEIFINMIKYLDSKNLLIKKSIILIISNFLDGDNNHFQICYNYNTFTKLFEIIDSNAPFDIKKEVVLCLVNSTFCGNNFQISKLVELGIIKIFIDFINENIKDSELIIEILNGIENILKSGQCEINSENLFKDEMVKYDGPKLIEGLQYHNNDNVYIYSNKILEKYFDSVVISEKI